MLRYTYIFSFVIAYQLLAKPGLGPLLLRMGFFSDYKKYKKLKKYLL